MPEQRAAQQSRSGPDAMSWPGAGSRFEADQFSPAGEVERFGWLAQAAKGPGALRRAARFNLVTKLMFVLLALMVTTIVVVLVASGLSRI